MPFLAVPEALFEPDFLDSFTVRRRTETIGSNGRSSVVNADTVTFGVVTSGPDNKLERQGDQQHAGKSLTIVTVYRIQGPSPGKQPDLILWGGDYFVVDKVDDYSRYGGGFVQAECSSIDLVDQPPGT